MIIHLNEDIFHRLFLTEGISDVAYHYCSLHTLYNILNDKEILLTLSTNPSDGIHKTKLFYLSMQRSKSTRLGYARNSKNNCRIEMDGYQLKADGYEGMPIDYWGNEGKQSDIGLNARRAKILFGDNYNTDSQENREAILKAQGESSNFEFEDRVCSSRPELPLKYIRRVDCLVNNGNVSPLEREILRLAEESNVRVFFYNNEKDFILQTNNIINDDILKIPGDFEPEEGKKMFISRRAMTKLCVMLLNYDYEVWNNKEVLRNRLLDILKKFDLEEFLDFVLNNIYHECHARPFDLIANMDNDIRRASMENKTYGKRLMLFGQYVLNTYGFNNFVSLAQYFELRDRGKIKEKPVPTKEGVECVVMSFDLDWRGSTIYKGDKLTFWKFCGKDQFYYEITNKLSEDEWNQQYGQKPVINYKSKNSESFIKYLQHLTHNDNLSFYSGAKILCSIYNNDFSEMYTAFGWVMKPIILDKDSYVKNEYKINFSDNDEIRLELFGDKDSYYNYLFPKSE
jgi:hypothetical protein